MIVIAVDHQTENVSAGINLTKLNISAGWRVTSKNAGIRLLETIFFYDF